MPKHKFMVLRQQRLGRAVCRNGLCDVAFSHVLVALVHQVVGAVHCQEATQFNQWFGMILDSKIKHAATPGRFGAVARDHEKRGGLLSPDIAAFALASLERHHQPLAKVSFRGPVGGRHGIANCRFPHQVGLHREPLTDEITMLDNRVVPGVAGDHAVGVDHTDLPDIGVFIDANECTERLRCVFSGSH